MQGARVRLQFIKRGLNARAMVAIHIHWPFAWWIAAGSGSRRRGTRSADKRERPRRNSSGAINRPQDYVRSGSDPRRLGSSKTAPCQNLHYFRLAYGHRPISINCILLHSHPYALTISSIGRGTRPDIGVSLAPNLALTTSPRAYRVYQRR